MPVTRERQRVRRATAIVAAAVLAVGASAPAAAAKPGDILVVDRDAPPGGLGALFRIDPVSGSRSPLAAGAPFTAPASVALEPSGQILVLDFGADGVLFRVDPNSGARTPLATGD